MYTNYHGEIDRNVFNDCHVVHKLVKHDYTQLEISTYLLRNK